MMSDSGKAVFLSYASQDADAARRICETLRGSGVEVWFDADGGLEHGDEWDAKIRRQIKECVLFMPIISANTQAREEGYFRIEWDLAAERARGIASGVAFILPVVIDDTRDADALVPDRFRSVQWTKLRGGEVTPEVKQRFLKLWSHRTGVLKAVRSGQETGDGEQTGSGTASGLSPASRRLFPGSRLAWIIGVTAAVVLVGALAQKFFRRDQAAPATTAVVRAELPELAAVRARIVPDRWQKEDFDTVSSQLDRLIQGHPDLADAWALRSIINTLQVTRNYESGTGPLANGKQAADRALRLAPGSPLGELALGFHLMAMVTRGGDPQAGRPYLDRGLAALPRDAITRYIELVSAWQCYDLSRTEQSAQAWIAVEPEASLPLWIMAQMNVILRHPDEVEKWAESAATDRNVTGIRAFYTIFESKYYLRADIAGARVALDRVPPAGRLVHRVVHGHWLLAMAERRWDDALQGLSQLTEPFLFDRTYHGPRALLAGLAHQRAGRADAAAIQFREAERLLRERLAADAENDELHSELAVTLASLGRAVEARSELSLVEPLLTGRIPSIYRGPQTVPIAQARAILGDTERLNFWLRKLFAEPSGLPFTPASLRMDARFNGLLAAPETQALLKEFAHLDRAAESAAQANDKSIAVLPFVNGSGDKENEFFSDGISEELILALGKIAGLKVPASTSSFHFKGKDTPLAEIARQLNVAHVVEGNVRKVGSQVRITAKLIKVADGFPVWSSGSLNYELKDVLALQEQIAGRIAAALQVKLGASAATAQVNPEAYQHLLQARFFGRRQDNEGWKKSVEECRAALALDPNYAAAAAELARAYIQLARFGGIRHTDGFAAARPAAELALRLDPALPEAHNAMGWVQRTADWNWAAADASFRRALELAPRNADLLRDYAVIRNNRGFLDEAIELGRRAVELDPFNAGTHGHQGLFLGWAGRPAEAEAEMKRGLALAPDAVEWHSFLARFQVMQGHLDDAAASAAREPEERYQLVARALVAFARKDRAAGEALRAELIRKYADSMSFYIAELYAAADEFDTGFEWLERARTQRETAVAWSRAMPGLRMLNRNGDPRWAAFLKKVGLADQAK